MKEVENILRIFEETKTAIKEENIPKLKELSNQTIHTASVTQDPDNILVAVVVYSLSKIIEREEYKRYSGWKEFYKTLLYNIDKTIASLKKNNEEAIKKNLKNIRSAVGKLSGKLKKYIQDVFWKAKINKASKIYEHGVSMEKTASLLGITMFDLAEYVGQKEEISEIPLIKTADVKSRIKTAVEMFK